MCRDCDGTGEVQVTDVEWDDCRKCDGKGYIDDGKQCMIHKPNKMKTLDEYNKDFIEEYCKPKAYRAGVLCPSCKTEMVLSEPGVILLSNPAQMRVHCPNQECTYNGTIYC